MVFPAQDTASLTPLRLVAVATSLMPEKQFQGFQEIEDGSHDFRPLIIIDAEGKKYILRTPLNDRVLGKFAAEIEITKLLAGKFEVPEILANNSRMAIYKPYRGRAFAPAEYTANQVKNLAKSLAKLHSLSYAIIEQHGLPSFANIQQQKTLMDVLDEAAMTTKVPPALLNRFEEFLNDQTMWGYDSTVINGDLRPQNILFEGDNVSCVLGWSALQFSDPAYDLAGITPALSGDFNKLFFEVYRKMRAKLSKTHTLDANLVARAEFYAQFELVSKLLFEKAAGNAEAVEEIAAELAKLDEKLRLGDELAEVEAEALRKLQAEEEKERQKELQDQLNTEKVVLPKNNIEVNAPEKTTPNITGEVENPAAAAPIATSSESDILQSSPSLKALATGEVPSSDIEKELHGMLAGENTAPLASKSFEDTANINQASGPFKMAEYLSEEVQTATNE